MNVLSLFDGMSCGLAALKRTGIKVGNYFASEIDKWAIHESKRNHPEVKHLGDIENYESWELPKIDLIIAGPPCQGFSTAGKGLNWDDPRSQLFFKAIEILWKYQKKNQYLKFMFENVASMKKDIRKEIDELMEVDSIMINSALVSAQNRKRLYWCNWNVDQPEDQGILLKDVIECGSNTLNQRPRGKNNGGLRENKSPSMSSSSWVDNVHVVEGEYVDREKSNPIIGSIARTTEREYFKKSQGQLVFSDKSQTIPATIYKENAKSMVKRNKKGLFVGARIVGRSIENPKSRKAGAQTIQILEPNEDPNKTGCISTVQKDNVLTEDFIKYRKLTPIECERLQTLPDNYTEGVSNTQRYKMIGNGWTVDVIKHIFEQLK